MKPGVIIDKNGNALAVCPHCGYDEFRVSVTMRGKGGYFQKFTGEAGENLNLHECLVYKLGKRATCANCCKYLGRFNETPGQ